MAYLYRLSGAMILTDGERAYLVGNLKRPCDFVGKGFEDPGPIDDAPERPWRPLTPTRAVCVEGEAVHLPRCDDETAARLASRFLITRNASVSERIWGMVLDEGSPVIRADGDERLTSVDNAVSNTPAIEGRWIVESPDFMFDSMREQVLRCS